MRIYINPLEMIKEVERDLFEMGTRYQSTSVQDIDVHDDPNYKTIELIGTGYKLDMSSIKLKQIEDMVKYRYKDNSDRIRWVYLETVERLLFDNRNPGSAWKSDHKLWDKFLRNNLFSYTYSERWSEQIKYILKELKRNPTSRQVVMTMYDRHQDIMNWGGLDRVPCSLSYHFLVRNDRLHLIYNQRSCDFINFFAADVFITLRLQHYVSEYLNVLPGIFTHNINSLHAFEKDIKGVF